MICTRVVGLLGWVLRNFVNTIVGQARSTIPTFSRYEYSTTTGT